MKQRDTDISKYLSLILRHRPDEIGIQLDQAGWTDVEALLGALARAGRPLSLRRLEEIVEASDKRRFAFNTDHTRIRANQGHSVAVELGLEPEVPPDVLFHGTAQRSLAGILREGLRKQRRHHVHLHADRDTALAVGARWGQAVLLSIDAAAMCDGGHVFFVTANDVWLTDHVPPAFITPV